MVDFVKRFNEDTINLEDDALIKFENMLNCDPSLSNLVVVSCKCKSTPLHYVVMHPVGLEFAKLLLQCGADVNAKDGCNETPLNTINDISNHFSLDIIQLLINYGVDINNVTTYGTIMQSISLIDDTDTIQVITAAKFLLEKGADINIKDKFGDTALDICARCSNEYKAELKLVKFYLENGATIDSVLLQGVINDGSPTYDTVKLLLEYGAKQHINTLDKHLLSPLNYAILCKDYDTVKLLLENGADVNAKSNSNWTPLHYALYKHRRYNYSPKDDDIVHFLESYSMNVAFPDLDSPDLNLKIVKLLLEYGAYVNVKSTKNLYPIQFIYQHTDDDSYEELRSILIEHSANIEPLFYVCDDTVFQNSIRVNIFSILNRDIKKLINDILDFDIYDLDTNVTSMRINIKDKLWINSSKQKRRWMARKLKYYSELDHRPDGKDERLSFVEKLYRTAVLQNNLNKLLESEIISKSDIEPLQEKIHSWKLETIQSFGS